MKILPIVEDEQMARASAGLAEPAGELKALDGIRCLLVEDDPDLRDLLQAQLTARGAFVAVAATVAEGIQKLQTTRFHVVLADFGLPDGDGTALVARAKHLAGFGQAVPVVAVTGHDSRTYATLARRAGFSAHVPKPVDVTRLQAVIRSLVG